MSHKCVRCSSVFPNNSPELMRGCTCGSRVFLFMRDESTPANPSSSVMPSNPPLPSAPSSAASSPFSQPTKTEPLPSAPFLPPASASVPVAASPSSSSDYGWLEDELAFLSKDKPVSIDVDSVENLRILEKGAYEIDLPSLFKGEPLVIKSDQHVYYVKLPQPKG